MNKILIPTDFSENSLKALEYTIENVKNIPIEIILVWVNTVRSKDVLIPEAPGTCFIKEAELRFEKLIEEYLPKLADGSSIHYHIRQGKVHIEVANQAKYDDVDLVVCCTHGVSGFEETYIGSNAYRIVMYCECPIITIRPNYRYQASTNIIVLPIDSSIATRQKVPFTCRLAKITGAKVHILGLYSSQSSSIRTKVNNYVAQVERFFAREEVNTVTAFREADNLTKAAISYAESVDADMLSIMTEQESSTWSFLIGTFAQQMLSTSTIPILSITPKNLMRKGSFS